MAFLFESMHSICPSSGFMDALGQQSRLINCFIHYWRQLFSCGWHFTALVTSLLMVSGVNTYDRISACRVKAINASANVNASEQSWKYVQCPTEVLQANVRLPSYCCGMETDKFCCEWSTYIINTVGFGSTSLGLMVFVGFFLAGSVVVIAVICGIFRICCVARWERQEQSHALRSRPIDPSRSRQNSFLPPVSSSTLLPPTPERQRKYSSESPRHTREYMHVAPGV